MDKHSLSKVCTEAGEIKQHNCTGYKTITWIRHILDFIGRLLKADADADKGKSTHTYGREAHERGIAAMKVVICLL
jgi:hypothetical protein